MLSSAEILQVWRDVLKANKQLTLQLINQYQAFQHGWENQVNVTQFSAPASLKYFQNESKNRGQARRWSMTFELQVVFSGKTKQARTKSMIWVFFPHTMQAPYTLK